MKARGLDTDGMAPGLSQVTAPSRADVMSDEPGSQARILLMEVVTSRFSFILERCVTPFIPSDERRT